MEIKIKTTHDLCRRVVPFANGAEEFMATVINHNALGIPVASRQSPPLGSSVVVRFGPGGFVMEATAPPSPAFSVVLVPTTHCEPEEPGTDGAADPLLVRIEAAWPLWSLTLRFGTRAEAGRFEWRVLSTTMLVAHWMYGGLPAHLDGSEEVCSPLPEEVVDSREVYGAYQFVASVEDREHRLIRNTDRTGASFVVQWVELFHLCEENSLRRVSVRFFDRPPHHGGMEVNEVHWKCEDPRLQPEIAGHLIIFRCLEPRGGAIRPVEVPRQTILIFRSDKEAEAWYDLATAVSEGDSKLWSGARARLLQCVDEPLRDHGTRATVPDEDAFAEGQLPMFSWIRPTPPPMLPPNPRVDYWNQLAAQQAAQPASVILERA